MFIIVLLKFGQSGSEQLEIVEGALAETGIKCIRIIQARKDKSMNNLM